MMNSVEAYKLSYRFAVATTDFNLEEGKTETNQQKWVKCNGIEKVCPGRRFQPGSIWSYSDLESELVDENGNVVRRGFVKINHCRKTT